MDQLSEVLSKFVSSGNVEELRLPPERVYVGQRKNGVCIVWIEEQNPVSTAEGERVIRRRKLPKRLDLWNHSPTGFEWGYGGSGPAQLALALLANATRDDEKAIHLHQRFKWDFVSRFGENWRLSLHQIHEFIREQERGAELPG